MYDKNNNKLYYLIMENAFSNVSFLQPVLMFLKPVTIGSE